ncbi:DUF6323 family protein [Acetivibrio cellulolyticus]|uniref:DUF6323 family protein n=1 Tax=Acetivibrio cellulolyticus TaxID=35830 RepID=UPI0002481C91|nr:DUF6323 family protein [Acetivibrio cellulolyticus]
MENNFLLITTGIQNNLAVSEIIKCNEYTARFGLILSESEVKELVETRTEALSRNGRIEFGGGIIDKLIKEFCDSPFLYQANYAETMHDLIETFYYFKNESLDGISDDELISLMKKYFDQNCRGSVELLQNRELETLARNIRYGVHDYEDIDDKDDYYDEEDDEEDE